MIINNKSGSLHVAAMIGMVGDDNTQVAGMLLELGEKGDLINVLKGATVAWDVKRKWQAKLLMD